MFWLQVEENKFPANFVPYFPQLPKQKKRTDFLTKEEFEKLYVELPHDLKPLLAVGYHTGARRGDSDVQEAATRLEAHLNGEISGRTDNSA